MCCLFGIIDYKHTLKSKQKRRMLSALAVAAEDRGTDATGIAYNFGGKLCVYKRPWPARYMRFRVPREAGVIMGHTRMTTQGSEHKNANNHPFSGKADRAFALAHNGILYNDHTLRRSLSLPQTRIETDSYIAVQLIEQKKTLGFDSLKYMAEQLEGSFTFTVLDGSDNLYIVKGDSPFCLYHYPSAGVFLYASTREILEKALKLIRPQEQAATVISLNSGDMLRIDPSGSMSRARFDDSRLYSAYYGAPWGYRPHIWDEPLTQREKPEEHSYLDAIKSVAATFGYTADAIDRLIHHGFTPEELEEMLYCGEM